MLDARSLIREKRERQSHRPEDLERIILEFAHGEIPDYQMSAWLMAAFLNGLDEDETRALTLALLRSGRRFDWQDLGRPSADKHSTGGVGDKVSLILAPLVASCGVLVPMVSGRGLGHTGGTLDKLESIPGFRTTLSPEGMHSQLAALGVVMVGQGPDLAPADGKLYALRDVTSTVEYEPFIVSSIVSKKIAEGAGAIAYDVKCGDGAFMKTRERARGLAERLVRATKSLGASAAALVTDMSQPLGRAVGNALEVRESIEVLQGRGPIDVRNLTLELAACMLVLSGVETGADGARSRAARALDTGAAWERFVAMVRAQGGDPHSVETPAEGLPRAPHVLLARAERAGRITGVHAFEMGELVVHLGGGRVAKEDDVDPRVGLVALRRVGDRVEAGEPLAEVHAAADEPRLAGAARACFVIEDRPCAAPQLIHDRVT